MKWKVKTYKTKTGKEPVKDFLRTLPSKEKAKVYDIIDNLITQGIQLGFPKTSAIKGCKKLRELRIVFGSNQVRIIYFLHIENTFILLHGFKKKTNKIPRKEVEIAIRRMEEYFE